jgi:hypothetical protein
MNELLLYTVGPTQEGAKASRRSLPARIIRTIQLLSPSQDITSASTISRRSRQKLLLTRLPALDRRHGRTSPTLGAWPKPSRERRWVKTVEM